MPFSTAQIPVKSKPHTMVSERLVSFWGGGGGCLCCVVTVSVLLASHITVLGGCVC